MNNPAPLKRMLPSLEAPPLSYRERDYVTVVVCTTGGEEIEGELSLPKEENGIRVRSFDYLERTTEHLLRLRNAVISRGSTTTKVEAVAISKTAVVRMHEKNAERKP